jgi:simple sugar transport system permease protein
MRFWNIGGEGQVMMGVLATASCMIMLGGKVPEPVLIVIEIVAAIAAGAIWAAIPAFFKSRWNTNETLFTLMMNYVATFIVGYFLIIWVPSGSSSLGKLKYGKLPVIVNEQLLTVIVVLLLTVGLYIYLNYTKHGYEISVVGESVRTAQYIGINERKVIIRTMILSGALCGLAGYLIAAGADQTVTTNSAGGQGFTGIMVAWLGKFNPLFMIVTAALIQILNQGASQISQDFGVNNALPNVFVGIVLFFIIGSEFFINYEVHFRGHAAKAGRRAIK